jgi:hypothetical protein
VKRYIIFLIYHSNMFVPVLYLVELWEMGAFFDYINMSWLFSFHLCELFRILIRLGFRVERLAFKANFYLSLSNASRVLVQSV